MTLTLAKKHTAPVNLTNKKAWTLSKRQLCDLECLINGAYAPLTGFLGMADYESVCQSMRLANGAFSNSQKN